MPYRVPSETAKAFCLPLGSGNVGSPPGASNAVQPLNLLDRRILIILIAAFAEGAVFPEMEMAREQASRPRHL